MYRYLYIEGVSALTEHARHFCHDKNKFSVILWLSDTQILGCWRLYLCVCVSGLFIRLSGQREAAKGNQTLSASRAEIKERHRWSRPAHRRPCVSRRSGPPKFPPDPPLLFAADRQTDITPTSFSFVMVFFSAAPPARGPLV